MFVILSIISAINVMDLQDNMHNDESESVQSTMHHTMVTCMLVNLFHKQPLEYCASYKQQKSSKPESNLLTLQMLSRKMLMITVTQGSFCALVECFLSLKFWVY